MKSNWLSINIFESVILGYPFFFGQSNTRHKIKLDNLL